MKKIIIILIFFIGLLLAGCYTMQVVKTKTIYIKGSDTMFNLVNRLAEEYMKENEGIAIYVEGGGTGTGVKALVNKKADICAASRTLKASETKLLADNFNSVGMYVRIAKDAVSIYLNIQNPVQNLTITQLQKIYSGEFNNWSEVGGINQPIVLLNRLPNSGSYLYLKDYVLRGDDFSEKSVNMPTYKSMLAKIAAEPKAIGYGGLWSEASVKPCKINGKDPIWKNIMNDEYPLSRYLYFHTVSSPQGEVQKFIDWVLSPDGQKVIKDVGYFPIWDF